MALCESPGSDAPPATRSPPPGRAPRCLQPVAPQPHSGPTDARTPRGGATRARARLPSGRRAREGRGGGGGASRQPSSSPARSRQSWHGPGVKPRPRGCGWAPGRPPLAPGLRVLKSPPSALHWQPRLWESRKTGWDALSAFWEPSIFPCQQKELRGQILISCTHSRPQHTLTVHQNHPCVYLPIIGRALSSVPRTFQASFF